MSLIFYIIAKNQIFMKLYYRYVKCKMSGISLIRQTAYNGRLVCRESVQPLQAV